MKVFHDSRNLKYRTPFGAVKTKSRVKLRIDIDSEVQPSTVALRIWFDNAEKIYPMSVKSEGGCFACAASVDMPENAGLLWYCFLIETDGKTVRYGNSEDGLGGVGCIYEGEDFKSYQITVYDKEFDTPEWFRGRIMYQIFPDRFFGVHENNHIEKKRDEYIIHYDRNEPISFNPHPYENGPACNDFYGGNLKGITAKLPYIKSLGVGVIYLNPIFEAYSNHKYDTADYKRIDQMFGTEEDFKELCQKAEELDIKIILDGVFSHTGADSVYFNKYKMYGTEGAFNDKNSPYRNWYRINDDNTYESWWGCSNLPNVNETEPSYLDYILRDKDSVIKKWLSLGASGWRLDVADELPDEFIKILRKEAKSEKSDAVIIGEVWEDASNKVAYDMQREYLLGDELDSVMNYPFKENITAFIMGWKNAEDMERQLASIFENYPVCVLYSLMNLIGTHDTMRIKSLFGGLNKDCAATRLSSGMEELATHRLMCAMFIQMTYVGVPSIYYGDEVGMQGGRDPFNREPFPWRSVDAELIAYTCMLGELRNRLDVLKSGFYKTLYAEGDVFVYARYFENKKDVFGKSFDNELAICAVNRSFEEKTITLDLSEFSFDKLYDGIKTQVPFEYEKKSATVKIPPVNMVFLYNKKF